MTNKEFNDLYNQYLAEFNSKFDSEERQKEFKDEFIKEIDSHPDFSEKIAVVSGMLNARQMERTNALVAFMLKRFLNIKD